MIKRNKNFLQKIKTKTNILFCMNKFSKKENKTKPKTKIQFK